MSGSTGVAVAVGEAVGLALGEADGLAPGEALGLAEGEALEAGLAATALSSTPRAVIPDGPRLIGEPISSVSSCVCTEERPEHISSRRTQTVTEEVR